MQKINKQPHKKTADWLHLDHADGSHGGEFKAGIVARLANVTRSTVLRWIRAGVPAAHLGWLRLVLLGELPWQRWRGWRVGDGWLQGPEGRAWDSDSLNATWLMWQQLSVTRAQLEALQAERDALRRALLVQRCATPWRRPARAAVQMELFRVPARGADRHA